MSKVFGLTAFIFGLLIIVVLYKDLSPFIFQNNDQMFYALWKQDVEKLLIYRKLPKQFTEIKNIEYYPLSEATQGLMKRIKAPIKINPKGKFILQISLDDWKDEKGHGYLIQYNLVDSDTKNTIWELGRTLSFNGSKEDTALQNKSESHQPLPASSPSKSQ